MYRIQINLLYRKLCVKLVTYQNYTKMHGQKNIEFVQLYSDCYQRPKEVQRHMAKLRGPIS